MLMLVIKISIQYAVVLCDADTEGITRSKQPAQITGKSVEKARGLLSCFLCLQRFIRSVVDKIINYNPSIHLFISGN